MGARRRDRVREWRASARVRPPASLLSSACSRSPGGQMVQLLLLLLLLLRVLVGALTVVSSTASTAAAGGVDFPILWDIGVGPPAVQATVPSLVKATPRVQLHQIIECPHPCGLLPSIGPNGPCDPKTAEYGCNGELPQGPNFNLTKHLHTLQRTFDRAVPIAADQWIDLDFESWDPLWNRTGAAYQNASIALVKTAHPDWSEQQLLAEATKEWEAAAMKLLLETIAFVKKIRPQLKVALYCYPLREYWNGYNTSSGDALRADNDRMMDLYCATDGIFPSVYQFYDSTGKPSTKAGNEEYVFTNVQEAVRIAGEVPAKCNGKKKPPVWVYTWHRYHGAPNALMSDQDESMYWEQSYKAGATGLVLWGSEPKDPQASEFAAWWKSNFTSMINSWEPGRNSKAAI
jgi:hypothetical protein